MTSKPLRVQPRPAAMSEFLCAVVVSFQRKSADAVVVTESPAAQGVAVSAYIMPSDWERSSPLHSPLAFWSQPSEARRRLQAWEISDREAHHVAMPMGRDAAGDPVPGGLRRNGAAYCGHNGNNSPDR